MLPLKHMKLTLFKVKHGRILANPCGSPQYTDFDLHKQEEYHANCFFFTLAYCENLSMTTNVLV